MHTRTLRRGSREAYNALIRIRIQVAADRSHTLITIFHLKPNGFYRRKVNLQLPYAVTLNEVVNNYEVLLHAA